MNWPEGWQPVTDGAPLADELRRELPVGHALCGLTVKAIARRADRDDVLFEFGDGSSRHVLVHLTWSTSREQNPEWPWTVVFPDLAAFITAELNNESTSSSVS
jgi:hypothetical protein